MSSVLTFRTIILVAVCTNSSPSKDRGLRSIVQSSHAMPRTTQGFMKMVPVVLTFLVCILGTDGNVPETKEMMCPCIFSVSRQVMPRLDDEKFDVFVRSVDTTRRNDTSQVDSGGRILEKHSVRGLRVLDATGTESGKHLFRVMSIAEEGLFRVDIRHQAKESVAVLPAYSIRLFCNFGGASNICPVLLRPDQPLPELAENFQGGPNIANSARIIGGLPSPPRLERYVVPIITSGVTCEDGSPACREICTGTLLSARWIVTAAHCVISESSIVLLRQANNRTRCQTKVLRKIAHPRYATGTGNRRDFDIAVVELREDIGKGCSTVPLFMSINANRRLPRARAFARAAGYGDVNCGTSGPQPENRPLRQVDVPIVDFDTCQSLPMRTTISRRRQICAGYLCGGGCGTCFRDSGGPLMQYSRGEPILVGVISSGNPGSSLPDLYVKPAGLLDWLRSTPAVFEEHSGRIRQVKVSCGRNEFLEYVEGSVSRCMPCPDFTFSFEELTPLSRSCSSCEFYLTDADCSCMFDGNQCPPKFL